jgi:hypothetical protein
MLVEMHGHHSIAACKLPQCLLVNGSSPPDHIRNKRPPPREVSRLVLDELETVRAAVARGQAFVWCKRRSSEAIREPYRMRSKRPVRA